MKLNDIRNEMATSVSYDVENGDYEPIGTTRSLAAAIKMIEEYWQHGIEERKGDIANSLRRMGNTFVTMRGSSNNGIRCWITKNS